MTMYCCACQSVSLLLLDTLKVCVTSKMAVIIVKGVNSFPVGGKEKGDKLSGTIDIWWILHILFQAVIELNFFFIFLL